MGMAALKVSLKSIVGLKRPLYRSEKTGSRGDRAKGILEHPTSLIKENRH
jgi:hypothetical protein